MHQLTKWCGLSFTLHLALGSLLILVAARELQPPRIITVSLDLLELPELPLTKSVPVRIATPPRQEPSAVRPQPVQPVPEPAKPLPARFQAPPRAAAPLPEPAAAQVPAQPAPARVVPEPVPVREPAGGLAGPRAPSSAPESATAPPRDTAPTAPVRSAPPQASPAPEAAQQRYLKEHFSYIRELVTSQLAYPPQARKMNWSGKTVLAFTITEDGNVHNLRLLQGTGFPILDKSALETVRRVAPFPKPPLRAEIVLPVTFELR